MSSKNRFSILLTFLMNSVGMKNYILAQELQYDVSYISKWVSGKVIPAEKTEKQVLHGISRCIVASANSKNAEFLLKRYQVQNIDELERAIFDHLTEECAYAREAIREPVAQMESSARFYPELPLESCIHKMHHPITRRSGGMEAIAMMDLMSMEDELRRKTLEFKDKYGFPTDELHKIHLSVILYIDMEKWDWMRDSIYLVDTLTELADTDVELYNSQAAIGKNIFVVKDESAISSMLISPNQCMSVVTTDKKNEVEVLYRYLQEHCTRDLLLFRRCAMADMIRSNEYLQHLLFPDPQWLIAHMTEHFTPPDLFEELVEEYAGELEWRAMNVNSMRTAYQTCQNLIRKAPLRLIFCERAFSDLAITGSLNFFQIPVTLTIRQRRRYVEHLLKICLEETPEREMRLVYDIYAGYQNVASQCFFLSGRGSYMSVKKGDERGTLMVINNPVLNQVVNRFFEGAWNVQGKAATADNDEIMTFIRHTLQGMELLAD